MNKKLILSAVVAGLFAGKLALANEHEGKGDDKAKTEHQGCKGGKKACNGSCKGKKKKGAKEEKATEAAPAPAPAPAPAEGEHH